MMEYAFWILLLLMPMFAFLYASVGHGGASSYLMCLTLFHFVPEQIRPTALVLNIFVSGVAFISFRKVCIFPSRLFLWLSLFSIPAAFLGGSITIQTEYYKFILGIVLLFPAFRLFNLFPANDKIIIKKSWWLAAIMGSAIGFLSGLIGIGGGIILSPLLLLMGWTNVKETSAVSALFIFLNSIAGLIGAGSFHLQINSQLQVLMPVTVAAGIAGAYFGAHHFNNQLLKRLLAVVLLIASTKFLLA